MAGFTSSLTNAINYLFSENVKSNKAVESNKTTAYKYQEIGKIWNMRKPTEFIVIDHNISYQEDSSVEWNEISPRGSIESIYTYQSTKARSFPLTFTLTDYDGSGSVIKNARACLRAWKMPRISSGKIVEPPPILMFYYSGFVDRTTPVKAILSNYSIRGNEDDGWNIDTKMPYTIEISLTLNEIGSTPKV